MVWHGESEECSFAYLFEDELDETKNGTININY
jgi:hypothetical protein